MRHQHPYNFRSSGGSEFGAFIAGVLATAAVGGYLYFGPNAKKNRRKTEAWMLRAKADLMEKTEGVKNITQEKYDKIVDEISDKYGAMKEVGIDKAERFGNKLKRQWDSLKMEAARREEEILEDAEDTREEK